MESNQNKHGIERRSVSTQSQQQYLDRKSSFRIDYRQRVDFFVKSILLLSSGILTVSMNLFLRETTSKLPEKALQLLQISWSLLFYTIISFMIGHFLIIIQGQYVNSKWDGKIPLSDDQISGNAIISIFRYLIWFFATTGFLSFLIGLILTGIVSIEALSTKGS